MYLKYRPVILQDLEECFLCIRDQFVYEASDRAHLLILWKQLLTCHAANAMVIENVSAPHGQRIVWFCMKVFVPNAYVQYLKMDAPPFIGKHILDQWCSNQSPLLDFVQMRQANSRGGSGLNLLVLNSGSPLHVFDAGFWSVIASKVVEFTPLCAGGYQLNELLIEVYDDFTAQWVEGTGMRFRTDYRDYYCAPGRTLPAAHQCPRLYGVTKPEADAALGTMFSAMFHRPLPLYHFTIAEQELLQWALFGESDDCLASALAISRASVRKRWVGIYDKVGAITPEMFLGEVPLSEKRGTEKKRQLLGYLRHHLEELRPVLSQK